MIGVNSKPRNTVTVSILWKLRSSSLQGFIVNCERDFLVYVLLGGLCKVCLLLSVGLVGRLLLIPLIMLFVALLVSLLFVRSCE